MLKSKLFRVLPSTLEDINNFLKEGDYVYKCIFNKDEKNRLFIFVEIKEKC